jgi:cytochrome P450
MEPLRPERDTPASGPEEGRAELQAIRLPTTRTSLFDPPPELAALRESEPVCRLAFTDGHTGWLVTRYEDARAVLLDARFSVRPFRFAVGDTLDSIAREDRHGPEVTHAISALRAGAVLTLDPPDHTRLRRLQTGRFSVARVAEHRPAIEGIVAELLDALEQAARPADLVELYALPMPSLALCHLLGIPFEARGEFEGPVTVMEEPHASHADRAAATVEFAEFADRVIEQTRAHPGDDLVSELLAAGGLTESELAGVVMQLVSAGHHTTGNMIALSVFFLLADRARWEALAADPTALPGAIEELLRYLNLVQTGSFARTALEDVEVGGALVRAGESVIVSLAAANRDPSRFPDPDRFDPSRDAAGHLAFGFGRHMCLGQHLARLELEVALGGLLRRFPGLSLAVPPGEVPMFHGDHPLYGVHEIPVRW